MKELIQKITKANIAYRSGEPILSDIQYDELIDKLRELDPSNDLLNKVGMSIDNDRKDSLPITMASMDKVKNMDEVRKWFKSKFIPLDTELVLTPKFDGISICTDESSKKAWTRGDGIYGQRSEEHILQSGYSFKCSENVYTIGEAIMSRKTFMEKYSNEYSNPRNLVAGQFNQKTPSNILKDIDYISFGISTNTQDKDTQLQWLNSNINKQKIDYKIVRINELSDNYLLELFTEWGRDYEIDGIIIEVNDSKLREQLGRETSSNNPSYARAYKADFEEIKETTIIDITYHISKNGLLKPVAKVEPVVLDGAKVENVTLNNARFVRTLDLGVGSIITVKRSGMVIPKLVSVVKSTGFELPVVEGHEITWDETEVELITKTVTDEQRLKQLVSFFKILEVDNLGEGTCKQFFNNGYDTPEKVLRMSKEDMLELDRFGPKKAEKVLESINQRREVTLSKLQHASGFFTNLGSRKLILLEHLGDNPTVEEISNIDGFSEISANNYLTGIVVFNEWVKNFDGLLTISKSETEINTTSSSLEGYIFVFTGVRRKDLEEVIINKGGKISSGVSSKTTHLVTKVKGSGSSKEKKAISLGLAILNVGELEELLR